MKTTQLRIEVLEERALMSASPLGEIAAPMPEPEAVEITVRKWEKISVPMTEEGQALVVNKLRGVLNLNPDAGAPKLPDADFAFPAPAPSDSLKYNFGGIDGAAAGLFPHDPSECMLLPAVRELTASPDDGLLIGMLLPAVQKVR